MSKKKNNPYWDSRSELVHHESPYVLIKRKKKDGTEILESVKVSEAKLLLGQREKIANVKNNAKNNIPKIKWFKDGTYKVISNNRKRTPGRPKHNFKEAIIIKATTDKFYESKDMEEVLLEVDGVYTSKLSTKHGITSLGRMIWKKGQIIKTKVFTKQFNLVHGLPNIKKDV